MTIDQIIAELLEDVPSGLTPTSRLNSQLRREGLANALLAEITSQREALKAAGGALDQLHQLVVNGVLVRNTSKDHEVGWSLHQLPLIVGLKNIQNALTLPAIQAAMKENS